MQPTTSSDPQDEIVRLAAECQYDPFKWAGVAWDWGRGALKKHPGPRKWQDDVNQQITEHLQNPRTRYEPLRIAVASGHGIGKSAEMGMLANWAMSCWVNARVMITANTMRQLGNKTSPEVGKWFHSSITEDWFDIRTQTIKLKRREDWRVDFQPWSDHNTEAFAGLHNQGSIILLLFDEGSAIGAKVWEVAQGALTDENTTIIWIAFGNPTQDSGMFRECFRRFRHRWLTRHIDNRTVEGINLKEQQRLVDDYGEDSDLVRVRVRGLFPVSSLSQWIGTDLVDAARLRHLRETDYDFAPVIIGVDPAWTGEDTLEVYLRQGLYTKHLLSLAKNDNDIEVANAIARFEDEYSADAVFIDMGFGTGIKSAGDVMGRNWTIIHFGMKSAREDCVNKRMEMWWEIKDWLKKGGAIDPKDDRLYEDLIGPELAPRADGAYQLESKQDMKARGLPSPNRGDALALTFALKVHSRNERLGANVRDTLDVEVEYDPLKAITPD